MKLVREATEAAESKKEKEKEAGRGGGAAKEAGSSSPENQFIHGTIALHDKYMQYVLVSEAAWVKQRAVTKCAPTGWLRMRECRTASN